MLLRINDAIATLVVPATKENVKDCENEENCRLLIGGILNDNPEYDPEQPISEENPEKIWQYYCDAFPGYNAYWAWKDDEDHLKGGEAYCTKITGYEQMQVEMLVLDEALQTAKQNRIAQEQAEKQAKEDRKAIRIQAIKDAIADYDNLTQIQKVNNAINNFDSLTNEQKILLLKTILEINVKTIQFMRTTLEHLDGY